MKWKPAVIAAYLLLFISSEILAIPGVDKKTLTGVVSDGETGETIPGVSVYFPDLKTGTITDVNGSYSISNLPNKKTIVQVSSIGYNTILVNIDLSAITKKDFILKISAKEINEVVISGSSISVEQNRTPTPVTVIPKTELLENASSNIIDAIAGQPGISQVSSGSGISKPVIRGLGYNRVVVVNDGVRQEGQQWGDEHGIEIDDNAVDKIEIIKGPASLMYGSDAIAGVIQMITAPTLPEGEVRSNAMLNYQTNSGLIGFSLNASGNKKGWIFDLRFSNKFAHDYKNKYDGYVFNSRYSENSLNGIVGLNRSWGYFHIHLSAFNLTPGIVEGERDSITGNFVKNIASGDSIITAPISSNQVKKHDPEVPYQEINHYKAVLNSSVLLHNGILKTIIGFQQNNRKEFADVMTLDQYGLFFQLNTINYDVKYNLPEVRNYNFTFGVNGMYQNSLNKGIEFLVPAYSLFDYGIFGLVRKNLGTVDISGGLRYDRRKENTKSLFLDAQGKPVAENSIGSTERFRSFDGVFDGYTGSIGTAWQLSNTVYSKLNIAAGFRAPNIAELGANGIHEGTFRYEIGNTKLVSEKSIQGDFAFGINTSHVTAEVALFDNHIDNYIYLSAINNSMGGDSIIDNNMVFTYISGTAELRGGEILIDIHPHPLDWLHFENSFSYVEAIQKNKADSVKYLPLIPAPKLNTEIKVNAKKIFKVFSNPYFKINVLSFFRQDKIFTAYSTETTTPGYVIVNAGIGTDISLKRRMFLSFHISLNNIADKSYQSHLSRLKYAPVNYATGRTGVYNEGRSLSVKMGFNF